MLIGHNIGSGVKAFLGRESQMGLIGHLGRDDFWIMKNPGPAAFGNFYPVFYGHIEDDGDKTKVVGRFRWKGIDLFGFYAILLGAWLSALRPSFLFGSSVAPTSSGVMFAVIVTLGLGLMTTVSVSAYRRHPEEIAETLRLLLCRN